MKKMLVISVLCLFTLTGCLYPDERLVQNQIPYEDQIASVQSAVNQYREANSGLLPIQDRDMETPIYQKYPINFNKIIPRYLQEPPSSAFESGGIFQYVLLDVETNPTVKLIDLRHADIIRDIKTRIYVYKRSNGYPPFEKMIVENVFTVDFKKLGYDEPPHAVSPYSGNNLPFVIDGKGEIYIDYSIDLYKLLQENKHHFKHGEDIRPILYENSPIIPAYSLPYTVENNEPVFFVTNKY
ncbi:hypothetical protein ACFSCX_18730 [Bacillus salitolerans]|uniref:ABC transporter periplasmic binding protein yphF n=1 Tax=Bacillus salitolerans TaxID=1437434 RepID=A0ABW4LTV4_9BACI